MTEKKTSFFGTLPGILTASAAILTALATLLISLDKVGYLDDADASEAKPITKPQPVKQQSHKTSQQTSNKTRVQEQTTGNKTNPPKGSINGLWIFTNNHTFSLDANGKKSKSYLSPIEHTIQLEENGNKITGTLKWTTKGCSQATISGTKEGKNINFTSSFTGACCSGAKILFSGKQVSENSLIGKIKPVDLPPDNCVLYWSDVTASRS